MPHTIVRQTKALRWLVAVAVAGNALGACGLTPAAGGQSSSAGAGRAAALVVGPDDGPAAILDIIRAARQRIWMEMYMLTSPEAVSALVAARAAGLEVRVLLEPVPFGAPDANEPAFAALAAAGVDVRWATRPTGLAHIKLLITDDHTALVMSLNLTTAGLGLNREFSVIDTDPIDVRWARALWTADAVGGDPGPPPGNTRLVTSPVDSRVKLAAAVDRARASIAIEMEEFSDVDLVSRLLAARDRGVAVTVVAPAADTSAATSSALRTLADAGLAVRRLPFPTLHAKAMVVDQKWAYVGSINFTRASLDDNREVGVLLEASVTAGRIGATIAADAALALPL